MFTTRVLVSFFEFMLSVVMSGFVIYLTYRIFIKANPDFDMEVEIKKGNVAVGTLVGAAIAFLIAPQSGEETREKVRTEALKMKEKADESGQYTFSR